MKELAYFEEKISNIQKNNEINNFYLFSQTILDYAEKYGLQQVLKKFNITEEDMFFIKTYSDAIKIGDFDKDTFKDFNLDRISEIKEDDLNESIKKFDTKYNNNSSNLFDMINNN